MAVSTATASPTTEPGKKNGWFVLHDGAAPFGFGGDWKSGYRLDWVALEVNGKRVEQDAYDKARKRHADGTTGDVGTRSNARPGHMGTSARRSSRSSLSGEKAGGARPLPADLQRPARGAGLRRRPDDLISLQYIGGDGNKRFLAGGRTGGGLCRLGLLSGAATIVICEGYATGATIHAATGDPVVIAFTCGNLLAVGKAMRARYRRPASSSRPTMTRLPPAIPACRKPWKRLDDRRRGRRAAAAGRFQRSCRRLRH